MLLPLLAACLLAAGCGRGGDRPETAYASGTVTLDGKPLSHGMVLFSPERGKGAKGTIRPDGSFELSTYTDGRADGAAVGIHQIAVFSNEESTPQSANSQPNTAGDIDARMRPSPSRSLIPRAYNAPSTSGLREEVKSGKENRFQLKLFSRAHLP